MTNWLADPVACAIRLKDKGGCVILAGRSEVLSRATKVYREVLGAGTKQERTIWSSGNIEVERAGPDERLSVGKPNLRLTVWENANNGTQTPPMLSATATLAADVLRAAAVNAGGSSCGGQTILELLWGELDVVMERLMSDGAESGDGKDPGRAEGIAFAIAVMQNPYLPNIDNVRTQAMDRWEEANPE